MLWNPHAPALQHSSRADPLANLTPAVASVRIEASWIRLPSCRLNTSNRHVLIVTPPCDGGVAAQGIIPLDAGRCKEKMPFSSLPVKPGFGWFSQPMVEWRQSRRGGE
jgi:hypothetical protein